MVMVVREIRPRMRARMVGLMGVALPGERSGSAAVGSWFECGRGQGG